VTLGDAPSKEKFASVTIALSSNKANSRSQLLPEINKCNLK